MSAHSTGSGNPERPACCRHHRRQRLSGYGPRRCLRCSRLHGPSPGPVPGPGERRPPLRPDLGRFVRCPGRHRPPGALRLRHGADEQGRHLAVERVRHRRAVRPGRVTWGSQEHRAVVDVGVSGDPSALRSGQAGDGDGGPCPRVLRRTPGLGLRSRLGWDGRDAAPAGCPSRCFPTSARSARQFTVSEYDFAAAVVALAGAEHVPALPVGIAHPDPVPFTDLLTSFAASQGKPRPRFVATPPMVVYAALRAAEVLPVKLPVRADSLLGLVRPAPNVPNLEVLDRLGVVLQPFALSCAGAGAEGTGQAAPGSSEPR